ncbi:MAG: DNA repair protein RecO [bacterium]|nr:DNA repair protein RecO [bacterium]
MTYAATAIILRRQDAHEWDRLYTVYTREYGKLLLVGKGTRRPRAKLASHLEPFGETEIEAARGRQIDRVTFARAIRTNDVFASSHEHLACASFLCESVDVLTKQGHPDLACYDLLREALLLLPTLPAGDRGIIPAFILRLMSILGYAPALASCIECRATLAQQTAVAVPHRGGVLCERCAPPAERVLLPPRDRTVIETLCRSLLPMPVSSAVAAFATDLLAAHLPYAMRTPLTGATGSATVAMS